MSDRLAHRGPDDRGEWVDAERGVALGHRRLAVIDLTPQGHQPMISASGRYVIIFNGEIYNFTDLRAELEHEHATLAWRGHSDTEVMLAAFERWGVEHALRRFNGMFAFALWDTRDHELHLARDRFGEKPLYYGSSAGVFLFGSELKAIVAHPDWQGDLDRGALDLYMRCSHVPGPRTVYRGLHKLPAGTYLRVRCRTHEPVQVGAPVEYWSALTSALEARRRPLSDARAAKRELEHLLGRSVMSQTVADVPLGAFLSGGIDSSLIVALMQARLSRRVQTFTIGYEETEYDESAYAEAVARHLGTEHTCYRVTPREVREAIVEIPRLYDEPFADSSQIPTFLVSRVARRAVTVALTGDGGDELFGGYHRYFVGQRTWRRLRHLPIAARHLLARALETLAPSRWDSMFGWLRQLTANSRTGAFTGERLHRLAAVMRVTSPIQMYAVLMTRHDDRSVLLEDGARLASSYEDASRWPQGVSEAEAMMLADTLTILCDDFLVKVDRAAMGVSLETRAPFLDPSVFEFAWRMPLSWRVSHSDGKILLRELLAQHVPRALIDRPKQGFSIPVGRWIRGPLRDWAESLLDERRLAAQGLLDANVVRRQWQQHLAGTHNRQAFLWSVLVLQQWLEYQRAPRSASGRAG